jgi:hypothetical protein
MFRVAPPLELKKLEALFRHKVFRMLLAKGKITREMIAMLSTWRHSGFQAFCGNRIQPKEKKAIESLARYIIRASFSQERMQYLADEGTVIYAGKRAEEDAIPHVIDSDRSPATCRRRWSRLIQKIYEVDPLICPKCQGTMKIISSIEDPSVIRAILDHLGIMSMFFYLQTYGQMRFVSAGASVPSAFR